MIAAFLKGKAVFTADKCLLMGKVNLFRALQNPRICAIMSIQAENQPARRRISMYTHQGDKVVGLTVA